MRQRFAFLKERRTAVLALGLVALLSGLLTGRELLFNLAYLLGLLLIISFLWAWVNIKYVYLSRVTRTRRTQVGRPLEERFIVRNSSIIPKLWLEVHDASSLPSHLSSHVVHNLGNKKQYSWRVSTLCRQRGRYRLGPIRLTTSDPFGLFLMHRELSPTTNVVIYPLTFDIHQFALPIGVLSGGDALRRRTHYVTTNASGVRDYAPGDSFGRIHWRSTARRNRLIVKEFELDPLADIWVVPDMSVYNQFSAEPESSDAVSMKELPSWMQMEEFTLPQTTEEYVVTIAASLSQYFIRRDRAVGLMAYGQSREILQPDRGERQMNRILETLSVLRAESDVPIADSILAESHVFPRGTTIIVITPTVRKGWAATARQLSRRGLRVVSVLVDPASFGGPHSSDEVMEMLQANGIITYMVRNGDNLTAALSQIQKTGTSATVI